MGDVAFVTGAGSGIGRACVAALAERGIKVVAGVLDEAQHRELLDAGDPAQAVIPFDVGSEASVREALETARPHFEGQRLVGVVNSAGIVVAGPLELLPDEDLRRQFDVNVFGLMSVTRQLLPRLREAGGRVVQVGSVGGRLSVPFTGAYSASKFAVRALSDALRVELEPHGVHVALIEPGPIATPIWQASISRAKRLLERLGGRADDLYGAEIERVFEATAATERAAIPVEHVSNVVTHAILHPRPRAQYLVGRAAWMQAAVSELPAGLRDRVLRGIFRFAPRSRAS